MADTGLLVSHAYNDGRYSDNNLYRDIFFGNAGVNNGMIVENAVAQEFRATGRNLYFYSRVDRQNRKNEMEIDFLIRRDGAICPVEVKSAAYQRHASLDRFLSKFKDRLGTPYIIYTKDIMEKDGIIHLPLYMAMFL
jgi:predicted AAA+ superfamily ATPase